MSDQIVAAMITGGCAVVAALIGLLARHLRDERRVALAPGTEPPVFRGARAYAAAGDVAGRRRYIHEIELGLSRGYLWLTPEQQAACAGSEWALDRIGLYLFEAAHGHTRPEERLLHVRHEWERSTNGVANRPTLPLRYALLGLLAARSEPAMQRLLYDNATLLADIRRFLRAQDSDAEALRAVERLLSLVRAAA